MRIGFSTDIHDAAARAGRHKFFARLAPALERLGVELDDKTPQVYLRLPHHEPRRGAVDVVRVDGLYFTPGKAQQQDNRKLVKGIRRADAVVFQGPFSREAYRKFLDINPPMWAEVLNGADPQEFFERRRVTPPDGPYRFLANASWRPHKRLGVIQQALVKALDDGLDAELVVTGEPDQQVRLDHPRVTYLGWQDREGLKQVLAAATASLHLTWCDWCPNAMVEAIVAGCPVIYTDSGGQAALGQGAGVAIPDVAWDFRPTDLYQPPPINTAAVARAMQGVADQPPAIDRPDLHIDAVAGQYLALCERALAAKTKRGKRDEQGRAKSKGETSGGGGSWFGGRGRAR